MNHANVASPPAAHARYLVAIARMTLWEGLRANLPWIAGLLLLSFWLLGRFLHQVSILEAGEISATVVGALTRLAAVFLTASFVVSSMAREGADKVTEFLLSQPAPRWAYLAGRSLGFGLIAVALGCILALPLWLDAPPGLPAWQLSLLAELIMVMLLSLLCSLTFAQPTAALSAIAGFYVLSRSIESLQLIAAASLTHAHGWSDDAIAFLINAIALLLPALGQMTSSAWLPVPPGWQELGTILAQALLYCLLLGSAALFDLYRKNY